MHIAFPPKLPFLEGIADMPGNHRLVAPEKLHHLCLRQPDCVVLQAHVQTDAAVGGYIQGDFAANLRFVLRHAANVSFNSF
jgi:hypothetical protein